MSAVAAIAPMDSVSAVTDPVNIGGGDDAELEDYYVRYMRLKRQLEFLEVQEEYIKDEQRNLKKEYLHAQEEVRIEHEIRHNRMFCT